MLPKFLIACLVMLFAALIVADAAGPDARSKWIRFAASLAVFIGVQYISTFDRVPGWVRFAAAAAFVPLGLFLLRGGRGDSPSEAD
ncbi:hypothetical protein [Boudabousia marimammalium]|uniref:Uncharacterized protein n=1 Tax=Boudabousia marimammalium TaxID=156892 RepID=A0A1Q5PSP5_9ACTO|nr:hypothetical protein [Boudabousia marimammalium]OKL50430.1 hypothetical protein BM477_00165 [Boudabousia marimammalium]